MSVSRCRKRNTTTTVRFSCLIENLTLLGKSKTRTSVPNQHSYLKVPTDFVARTPNPHFFIGEQQIKSPRTPNCPLLFNLEFLNILNCLRVLPDHATPTFSDLKVYVYGMKGIRLWYERYTFMV